MAVPSRVSLPILHTQAESGAYSRDSSRFPRRLPFIYLNRHTPLGQSRVYRVTQLRTDGVHCQESAGTGPVVLKAVPVTGAAFLQVTMNQLMCAFLYEMGMLIEGNMYSMNNVDIYGPNCNLLINSRVWRYFARRKLLFQAPFRSQPHRVSVDSFGVVLRISNMQGRWDEALFRRCTQGRRILHSRCTIIFSSKMIAT